jgi:hypothetical protein
VLRVRVKVRAGARARANIVPGPNITLITARVSAPGGGKLPVAERV